MTLLNFDLHTQTSPNTHTIFITQMFIWEIMTWLFKDPTHVLIV